MLRTLVALSLISVAAAVTCDPKPPNGQPTEVCPVSTPHTHASGRATRNNSSRFRA